MADIKPKIAARPTSSKANYESIYQLKCFYRIDTPVCIKDLPEIDRKAAIIMACHLLYKAHGYQKCLRPLVAAEIYRKMPDINCLRTQRSLETEILDPFKDRMGISFDTFIFVRPCEDHRVIETSLQAQGSQEIIAANKFLVTISYSLTMTHCALADTVQNALAMFDGLIPNPEPHYSWQKIIEKVDAELNYSGRNYSAASEDWDESECSSKKFPSAMVDIAISSSHEFTLTPLEYVTYSKWKNSS